MDEAYPSTDYHGRKPTPVSGVTIVGGDGGEADPPITDGADDAGAGGDQHAALPNDPYTPPEGAQGEGEQKEDQEQVAVNPDGSAVVPTPDNDPDHPFDAGDIDQGETDPAVPPAADNEDEHDDDTEDRVPQGFIDHQQRTRGVGTFHEDEFHRFNQQQVRSERSIVQAQYGNEPLDESYDKDLGGYFKTPLKRFNTAPKALRVAKRARARA